jgi:5-methylthioadenosine/S-adenosylhomocysteine deaminase
VRKVSLLISGGTVITMNAAREVIEDGAVAIEGNTIAAVGPRAEIERNYEAERSIDGGGSAVIPGLVNAHTHTFQNLYKGLGDDMPVLDWIARMIFPLSEHLAREEAATGAELACLEMIRSGVTCFTDSFYIHRDPEAVLGVAEAVETTGLRALVARAAIDQGDVPASFKESTEVAVRRTEEAMREWNPRSERVQICPEALFTLFASPGLVAGLRDLARRHHARFHMHAGESIVEAREIRERHGRSVFEYLDSIEALGPDALLFHAVWCSQSDTALLAERRTSVSHNPVSNQYLASGIAPVADWLARGVTVALGTDGAASNNTQDMFETMKSAALLQKVARLDARAVTADQALEMATLGGARALGMEDRIGSIEAGKRADLAVVSLEDVNAIPSLKPVSSLVYTCRPSDVSYVLVDGRVILDDGEVVTLEEREVLERGREVARRMVDESGTRHLLGAPRPVLISN